MAAIQYASFPENNAASYPSIFDTKTTYSGVTGMETGNKEIVIRNMVIEDSDFVGEMVTEAFRDKMEHAVGRDGLPGFIRGNQEYFKGLKDCYHRFFVAELGGERAGMLQLGLREDNFKEPDDFSWGNYVGCCATLRFMSLACLDTCTKPKLQECYVGAICVDSKFRGCGIGKALLDRADDEGRALGCNMMSLDCTTTNRARNLYLRQGYKITQRIDGCCFTWFGLGVRYFYRMEKQL